MALTSAKLVTGLQWILERSTVGDFAPVQHSDALSFAFAPDLDTYTQLWADEFEIAAAASTTVDFRGPETNPAFESVTFASALLLIVQVETALDDDGDPLPGEVVLSPGAANPLTWFFGSATDSITIPTGGAQIFCGGTVAGAVSGTAKTLKFANNGSNTVTVKAALLGGV